MATLCILASPLLMRTAILIGCHPGNRCFGLVSLVSMMYLQPSMANAVAKTLL